MCIRDSYITLQEKANPVFLSACTMKWNQIQNENATLRAMLNGKLQSVSEDIYDRFILREIAEQPEQFKICLLDTSGGTPPYRKVRTDAPGIFKGSPPSQIEYIDTDRRIVDISCRPERTGTGTVRHYHGCLLYTSHR